MGVREMNDIIPGKIISIFIAFALGIFIMLFGSGFSYADSVLVNDSLSKCSTVKELSAEEKAASDFKSEVVRLVNIEREKALVPKVVVLNDLAAPSDIRALETKLKFSHTRPDGSRWSTVFKTYSLDYMKAGENLAYGYKKPKEVVKTWMSSKSHRENILNPEFEYIGVGYYKDIKGIIYVSQLFYTPISKEGLPTSK